MIKQGSVCGHRNAGAGQTGRTTENEIIDPMVTGRDFPKNQKTGNSSAEVVAWDVDIEEEEPSEEKGILIPGYTSMVMKANTKEQTVSIGNPADNDCIFVIVLKLEDGTKLFESQELKPGEGLENITFDQELEAGEYQAVIEYKCYSLEDKSPLNGGSAEFKLYVKE